MEKLLDHTVSIEQFRLSVIATDESLLKSYKEVIAKSLESDKKEQEFRLRDIEMAEAKRLQKLQEPEKKNGYSSKMSFSNSL